MEDDKPEVEQIGQVDAVTHDGPEHPPSKAYYTPCPVCTDGPCKGHWQAPWKYWVDEDDL